jgi:hypothetical protein
MTETKRYLLLLDDEGLAEAKKRLWEHPNLEELTDERIVEMAGGIRRRRYWAEVESLELIENVVAR